MEKKVLYLMVLVLGMAGFCYADLGDDLVGYYKFDGDLTDSSGSANVNDATAVGSPDVNAEGLFGQAAAVGGVGNDGQDYVSLGLPSDYQFDDDVSFTIAYWLRMPDYQTNDPTLVGNKDWSSTGLNQGFTQAIAYDDVKVCVADGQRRADTDWIDMDPDTYWGDGQAHWTFCAMVVDRDAGIITNYVADEWVVVFGDDASTPTTADISSFRKSINSGYPINVGQDGDGEGYDNTTYAELIASFDDMAIWRRALSQEELQEIYSAGRSGISLELYLQGVTAKDPVPARM